MNIAEITTFEEGGAYTHVIELIKGIDARVLIITGNTQKKGYEQKKGNTYFHIPCLYSVWDIFFVNRAGSYGQVADILKKNNIELVHFHSPLFTFLIGLMRRRQYPLIMTTHYLLDIKANRFASFLYRLFIRWMTLTIAQTVDTIICVNEEYIPIFTRWGIDPKKLVHIPNGVDTKRFYPGPSTIKKKFQDHQLIVYFGRLHYQKNVDILIHSFRQIKEKVQNVKLVIIGDGIDFPKLKKMSAGDSDIIMTGFVSDSELVDYLRAANVVVFPSRGENASFTLLEAMACGLPVISSDVGTAKWILAEGRGLLLQQYTQKEIAELCVYLLQNPAVAEEIGEKARQYVQHQFSWDSISKKTELVYQKLIEKNRQPTYSVVIPTLNEEKNIAACIQEIQKQAPGAEIIVVDGQSSDKTLEITRSLGATVLVEPKPSVGAARTKGLKHAQGDIVCFVDADTIPAPGWFEKIILPFQDQSVVGVGGMASPLDGTWLERFGLWLVFAVASPILFEMRTPLVTGQNMAFRRQAALDVGGFYEVVKPGRSSTEGEDTVMFLRIKNHGKIVHSHACVCVSMRRVRAWGLPRFLTFNIRNYLHLLKYQTPLDDEYEPIRR